MSWTFSTNGSLNSQGLPIIQITREAYMEATGHIPPPGTCGVVWVGLCEYAFTDEPGNDVAWLDKLYALEDTRGL